MKPGQPLTTENDHLQGGQSAAFFAGASYAGLKSLRGRKATSSAPCLGAAAWAGKRQKVRGVTLLEVLIAVVILAIGLLGVAALQTQAVKASHSAAQKSQAAMLAYLMLDAMRANRDAALAGAYNLSLTCEVPTGGTLPQNDQRYWLQRVQEALGATACGQISCDSVGNCTVTLSWDDSRAGGSAAETFSLTSRL